MTKSVRVAVAVCLLTSGFLAAQAAIVPGRASRFDRLAVLDPSSRVGLVAERPEALPGFDQEIAGWAQFKQTHGSGWSVWVDRRSGSPTLVEGRGIPMFPAGMAPSLHDLETKSREFVGANAALFRVSTDELVLNSQGSGALDADHATVVFDRQVGGVPVENQRFILYFSRGSLVAFGADRWGRVTPRQAAYGADTAREVLYAYMGLTATDSVLELEHGELAYVNAPVESGSQQAWTGATGAGMDFRLVRRFRFQVAGERGTWVGKVDATTGEIVAFEDDNQYGQVKGGVFPVSNDGNGFDGTEQPGWPMPYADVTIDGVPYTTNDMGMFECAPSGGTAVTHFQGPYIRVSDTCGSMNQSVTCDADLDLSQSTGTDCAVPPGMGSGDTHSARSGFYHLNRVMEKGRAWLPTNSFLQSQMGDNVNIFSTCNAFWDGSSVNFYRSGGGCRNTGEIAGVFVHEWGHGIDQYDGGGYDNPSEAYADIVAFIQTHVSCVGRGFFMSGNCSGYGDACLDCSGIRDQDWDKHASHTPATATGFAKNNCGGGSGPCGKEVHCESYVAAETVWDLATRDLPATGLDLETSWQTTDKLFYKSRQGSGGNAYNCNLSQNTSDGCGAGAWFTKFRTVDDDDGNLNNGTPHAAAIYAAFARHGIACGNASDASNQNSSTCPALSKPTLTSTAGSGAANLSWTPVSGASSYLILRNDQGCNTAHTIVATVAAPATSYVDSDLPNGFPVYYAVQAQGTNTACESALSNCQMVTPQPFAGTIKLDQATYGCSNTITVQVLDANIGAPTTTATIASSTETAPETLLLTETPAGSAKYVGTITTTSGPAATGDGLLSIHHGDTITARYVDANDGLGGTNLLRQTTAAGDCVFPIVSQVGNSGTTDVRSTVTWATDEISTSVVKWGELRPPSATASTAGYVTQHTVDLTGLRSCTVYWFSVQSTDRAGNVAVADNAGQYYHFETLGNFGSGLQSCHAGKVLLSKSVYSCADTVTAMISDIDENLSPTAVDTITVDVASTTEAVPETVVLTETGPNTSTFRGSISTTGAAPVGGNGLLSLQDLDVITVTYHDRNDGSGSPTVNFATATADCGSPGLSGVAVTGIRDDGATIQWNTSEPADGKVEWGTTPALGNVVTHSNLTTSHSLTVSPVPECGTFYFRVSSKDVYGYTTVYDNAGAPFVANAYLIPGAYFKDLFETNTGWSLSGEFQIAAPQGLGTSPSDPATAFEGTKVLGEDLTGVGAHPGDYELSANDIARSPVIDATNLSNLQLKFRRWLNVGNGGSAAIQVNLKGGALITVYSANSQSDSSWNLQTIDLPAATAGNPNLQITFRTTGPASGITRSGWNIDRFMIRDGTKPEFDVCGGCGLAPTFRGAASARDTGACADTGVTVSWADAPAWGTGHVGTYAIYRDASPSFTPSAANLVASGVGGNVYNDTTAPNGTALYYVVRAENDETCSSGPHNGGMVDPNLVRVTARDDVSQPVPADTVAVLATPLDDAHVRLSWGAVPSAATYRIYRAASPQGPWSLLSETTGLRYDDLNQMGNQTTWYYRVEPVSACGVEAP